MKRFTLLVAAMLCTFAVSTTLAQKGAASKGADAGGGALRIAVADMEKIAKELPEALEADKMLTAMRQKYVDSIQTIEKQYKEKIDAYTKSKSMMTPDAQKKEEDELRNLQQQYVAFQEDKFGAAGELARKRDELLRPLLLKVQQAVQAVAKEEHYTFVFDKAANTLLYAEDKTDITFKVIDKLKRGNK